MMRFASLGLVLSLAACQQDLHQEPCETANSLFGNCGGGGGGGGPEPAPPAFQPTDSPYLGSTWISVFAAGGTGMLTVEKHDGVDTRVELGDGPLRLTLWSADEVIARYVLSSNGQGDTAVTIVTDNYEPITETIQTRSVRRVALIPKMPYVVATADPAYSIAMPDLVVALYGDDDRRLVDLSLDVMGGEYAERWDQLTLSRRLGTQTFVVQADSFGTRQFDVDVVSSIDRIEATLDHPPETGTTTGVCFNAYAGDREVIAPFQIQGGEGAVGAITNCAQVSFPVGAWRRVVTATSLGVTKTVELTLPQP